MSIISQMKNAKLVEQERGFIYWDEKVYTKDGGIFFLRAPKNPVLNKKHDYNLYKIRDEKVLWTASGEYIFDEVMCISVLNISRSFLIDYGGGKYDIDLFTGVFFNGRYVGG